MQNSLLRSGSTLLGVIFVVIVIGSYVIVAQSPITGEWTADARIDRDVGKDGEVKVSDPNKIQLNFERRTARGGKNQNGSSYTYDQFQGLTREQAQNGKVSFRLVREAGTVDMEGTFVDGRGSGTFTFTPDPGYLETMRARGFDFAKEKHGSDNRRGVAVQQRDRDGESILEQQFAAALLNVTTALADDLKSVGFGNLDVSDLFSASIFKVDSKFLAEMKATGFPNLKMEDLVQARIFKIDADFVKQVHEMGFSNRKFNDLVQFRIFQVTPEFLSELKSAGFANLSPDEIVKFRIFKIDPEFIRKARAEDPNVTVEDMVQMKIGVRRMKGTF